MNKTAQNIYQTGKKKLQKAKNTPIYSKNKAIIDFVKQILGDNEDLTFRHFRVLDREAVMIFLSNFSDENNIIPDVMRDLMNPKTGIQDQLTRKSNITQIIYDDILSFGDATLKYSMSELVKSVIQGHVMITIEGEAVGIDIGGRQVGQRAIDQPPTEQVIRGARDGFIEQIDTNISLLRYRLQTPDFTVQSMQIGDVTDSKVVICFLKGIANNELIQEVKNRLSKIEIDGVLDAGYLEQLIEDNRYSPFPQIQFTERPDNVVAQLLEGRVMVMVDGSPFALIMPAVFSQFYQTTEDYSERFLMGTLVRMIRFLALVFALFFPAIYVSIISFNPELIPTDFAVAVAGGRAGVPFPAVIEVLIMEVSMEVLREATIRLPQQVGGALSIVGVLVVGQAAVSAGFASPITVVVIALTTIGSFATPAYNAAIALRMLRFPLVMLAGAFGLYGVMIGLILIVNHMLSLRSFGVPYMAPVVPGDFQGMKDTLIRGPLWWLKKRPSFLYPPNRTRIDTRKLNETYISGEKILNYSEESEGGNDQSASTKGSHSDSSSDHHR